MSVDLSAGRPAGSRAAFMVSPASVLAEQGRGVPPLQWWRRLSADAFTTAHLEVIQRAVSGICILGEPRWPDAVNGDPAAAVGVALRAVKRRGTPGPVIDLVMSAVLRCAVTGDQAAISVLVTMINRIGAETEKKRVRQSWRHVERRTRLVKHQQATLRSRGRHRPKDIDR
jgi:hypothetical protein